MKHSLIKKLKSSMLSIQKIVSLVIILVFAMNFNLSAQKCKYDYEKKDPITNELTKGNSFPVKTYWKIGLNKLGNQYWVGMYILYNTEIKDIITPENTMILKLQNGEIITVNASENFPPSYRVNVNSVAPITTAYQAKFTISEEDLKRLSESPLVFIRMGVGSRTQDSEIKNGSKFQNNAKCILQ